MDGYRQDSFDLDAGESEVRQPKGRWWKVLLATLAYMIPLFVLWDRTNYPDSLGVQITAHGKAGFLENWYYSYLLLQRHRALDVLTFAYMWAPIVGYVGWLVLPKMRGTKFSLYDDQPVETASAPPLSTPSVFGEDEAAKRRSQILVVAMLLIATVLLTIRYF
jgi:hypothetical protein